MALSISNFRIKTKHYLFAVLATYIIFCQSCMMMRTSPKKTILFFKESNISFIDKTVTIDQHQIHYIATGQEINPTLIFIHGSPGSWDAFKKYLADPLLLQKYHMIAIDRPGFGHSNFGKAENLRTQSLRIRAFLKIIDIKKPIALIGHSLGGPLIVEIAIRNPNDYKHLVILSGSIDPDAEKKEKWRNFINKKPFRYLIPGALRPANDELWWLKQDLVDMKPFLKEVTCPITLIHGTKDRLVPFSNVGFMQKEFINSKDIHIIAIDKADHFIPWSHFEIIRNALLALKL